VVKVPKMVIKMKQSHLLHRSLDSKALMRELALTLARVILKRASFIAIAVIVDCWPLRNWSVELTFNGCLVEVGKEHP
jgi:hypothetical protein